MKIYTNLPVHYWINRPLGNLKGVKQKMKSRIEKIKEIEELRIEGKKIIFTNGCFDIMHVGHLRYLKKAKEFGEILIIGLNTDNSIKRIKGDKRPIIPEDERAELLEELRCVDYVIMFDEDTPVDLVAELKPDVYVKGGDYTIDQLPEAKIVHSYNGEVKIVNFIEGRSTTSIIKRIKELT